MAKRVRDSELQILLSSYIFFPPSIFGQLTNNFCLGLLRRPQPHLKRDLIEVLFNKGPQVVFVVAGTLFFWVGRRLRDVGVAGRPHDNSVKHLSGLEFEVPEKSVIFC